MPRFTVFSWTRWSLLAQILLTEASVAGYLDATKTCIEIEKAISDASEVLYAVNPDFEADIEHWFLSSTQVPACVVEVGCSNDVSIALRAIAKSRTPFAVESGGHASNPGFSSTTGVHISMAKMKTVKLSADKSSVELGMGLTWAKVYSELQGTGVNVVGGRTPGPGVGGFTLGGGYSWKTNQYGLTCDNVQSYTLVLPNGTVSHIDQHQTDLFFALKGGMNRFGIVTSAVYSTHIQPAHIYGGYAIYPATSTSEIVNATRSFYSKNTDSRAQIITTLSSGSRLDTSALVIFYYDGAVRPASFAPFDDIAPLVNEVKAQSFSSFVASIPSKLAEVANFRGAFNTMCTSKLTLEFLKAVKNETDTYGAIMSSHGGIVVSYDIEPFLPTFGEKATNSSYPHSDSPLPLNLYFAWLSSDDDSYWYQAMRASVRQLRDVATQEGIECKDSTAYPNYAMFGTNAEQLYGVRNAARLSQIRKVVDPENVMELTGGFSI